MAAITMRMELILVRIASALMFVGAAALAAIGLDHFAHVALGVSRMIIRQNAIISAVVLSCVLLFGLFVGASDNKE